MFRSKSMQDSHINTGLRKILEIPFFYEMSQIVGGGDNVRKRIVKEYIKPFDGASVLDIGCGTGKMLDFLPQGIDYYGYDFNKKNIELAQKRYKDKGKFFLARVNDNPEFHQKKFDFVFAITVLHHLYDEEADRLISSAHSFLKPKGIFISLDPVYLEKQSPIARFIISKDRGQMVRYPEGYSAIIKKRFSRLKTIVRNDMFLYPYSLFISKATKE